MATSSLNIPPPPPGFELENVGEKELPPLPQGFELEAPKKVSRPRSLISALTKGLLEGTGELTEMSPIPSTSAIPENLKKQLTEHFLPSRNLPLEKGLQRVGRLAPLAATGGEGLVAKGVRTGLGALAGQVSEELGEPGYIQNLAELSAFLVPKLSGKFSPTKIQDAAVGFLRKKGLNEKEITPLIQSEKKLRTLGKFATKSEKTKETLRSAGEKLGQGFEDLKATAKEKQAYLPREKTGQFLDEFDKTLDSIRPRFKRLLADDVKDFENSRMGFNDMVDFWQDINTTVKGHEGGRAVLNKLKIPLQKGLKYIDPELADEFNKLNEFYSKKAKIGKILNPKQIDELLEAGKIYGILGSLASGNFGILGKIVGLGTGKEIARQLLVNPKLQNLSNQMLKSINMNKIPQALKLYSVFLKEYKKSVEKPSKEIIADNRPQEP